jgi:hypothetical protein
MSDLEKDFHISSAPVEIPYTVFVDDTCANIIKSRSILGLCIKHRNDRVRKRPRLSWAARKIWKNNDFSTYNSNSGISQKGIRKLQTYIKRNHANIKNIVLDWDHTLTQHGNFRGQRIDKAMCECYFGGLRRMTLLKSLFKTCDKKNVQLFILTYNRRAKTLTGKTHFYTALAYMSCVPQDIVYTSGSKIRVIETF